MAHLPALQISVEDRAELERRVRSNTVEARAAQRARLVLLAAEGLSNRDIGTMIGMHYNQVALPTMMRDDRRAKCLLSPGFRVLFQVSETRPFSLAPKQSRFE